MRYRSSPVAKTAAVCFGVFALLSTLGGVAGGQDGARGALDGMAFVGKIGPAGAPDMDDALYFEDGHFWSQACTRCGFAPGPYWYRHIGDAIEFHGVLESEERGRFSYLGIVRDGRISASINWRHDRWYWSIDRDLSFDGDLADANDAALDLGAARRTAEQDPENPEICPS